MLIISTQRYEDKFLEVGMNKQVRMMNYHLNIPDLRPSNQPHVPEEHWISKVELPEERAAPKSSN
jgi:hypothetical protein